MRRTYRSKKDIGGGLQSRDMLSTLDCKRSTFDAFYIQNIKRTKREFLCMGSSNHYSATKQKVCKKKLMKRIMTDVKANKEESMSPTTFLTPDRSIRVNKALDLFDQLLNSSTTRQNETPKARIRTDLHTKLLVKRETYMARKLANGRQNNGSSSSNDSSASDKKNDSHESISKIRNTTNVKTYELLIEKAHDTETKICDESINNVLKNVPSIIHKDALKTSFNLSDRNRNINRLTNNVQSPISRNTLITSTPFTEKNRSKSIHKCSPIPLDFETSIRICTETSPNVMTDNNISKNSNDSIVSQNLNIENHLLIYSKLQSEHKSPITHFRIKYLGIDKNDQNRSTEKNIHEHNLETSDYCDNSICVFTQESCEGDKLNDSKIERPETTNSFLGLPCSDENDCSKDNENQAICLQENRQDNENTNRSERNQYTLQILTNENSIIKYDNDDTIGSNYYDDIQCTNISEPFLGFSNTEKSSGIFNEKDQSGISVHEQKKTSDSNNLADCEIIDNITLYDTCDSEKLFTEEEAVLEEPAIFIENMNDSMLRLYCDKRNISNYELEKNGCSEIIISNDNNSYTMKTHNSLVKENEVTNNEESVKNSDVENMSEIIISSNENSFDSNNNDEEERCFVTTRKKNEFTLIDQCNASSSSSYNYTVLNKTSVCAETASNTSKVSDNILVDNTIHNAEMCEETNFDINQLSKANTSFNVIRSKRRKSDGQTPLKAVRKSYRNRESAITNQDDSMRNIGPESHLGIVLFPGKKWERSLSIYRRMTVMTDHSNESTVDSDILNVKGRKYRQSVINTMELQETIGFFHNESINSRRSTFVSKPCSRSSIRIAKEESSRLSVINTTNFDELTGFLTEDCDDTIVELSKLSIADSDITIIEKIHDNPERITTARDYVLRRCNQAEVILFDECYPDSILKNCRKIGEGVYGEVFLWRAADGRARVMKIVPIAGKTKVNGEDQKDFQGIISEIVIAMELSALRAPIEDLERQLDEGKDVDTLDLHTIENATDIFNEVLAVRCVYGTYPSRLLDLWDLYDECKGSENDDPAKLPFDQQYIVLELANAGQDLESYLFNSAEQTYALFVQIAFGIAVAEEAYQFEHRDLHWGNVLIASTDHKYATFVLRGRSYRVPRCGVAATIIDYSLSRVSLPLTAGADSDAASVSLYNDLATDVVLFQALGDYQFEVYRLMRDKLGNEWKNFEPYTNILWLHYTVDKMITAVRYKRKNTKIHRQYISKLKGVMNRILQYGSATQFVLTDDKLIV